MSHAVPVILLTGFLGAGKTSLLNHLLRHPDARIGVVVNDFGDLNIDAGLVVGQVDEPFSISGGCICCLSDDTSLEDALVALAKPRLDLDAIIVEASGFAEPLILARMITRMGRHRFHLGGVIDVVDAPQHSSTVSTDALPPVRYAATTLVLVNKLDQLPEAQREAAVESIRRRVHLRNPRVHVIGTSFGYLDPNLIFDPGSGRGHEAEQTGEAAGQPVQPELPIRELLRQAYTDRAGDHLGEGEHGNIGHRHAQSLTVTGRGHVDPDELMDFLEDLPTGVYRVKGTVQVAGRSGGRRFDVQAVGPNVYVSGADPTTPASQEWDSVLVVIGESFDAEAIRPRLERALTSTATPDSGEAVDTTAAAPRRRGLERLLHHQRLHS